MKTQHVCETCSNHAYFLRQKKKRYVAQSKMHWAKILQNMLIEMDTGSEWVKGSSLRSNYDTDLYFYNPHSWTHTHTHPCRLPARTHRAEELIALFLARAFENRHCFSFSEIYFLRISATVKNNYNNNNNIQMIYQRLHAVVCVLALSERFSTVAVH